MGSDTPQPLLDFAGHYGFDLLCPIDKQTVFGITLSKDADPNKAIEAVRRLADDCAALLAAFQQLHNSAQYAKKLRHMLSELSGLHELGRTLQSLNNINSLLEFIMQRCMALAEAEAASLMMVDKAAGDLEFKVVLGSKAEEVKPFRLPIGQGITGWVAQTGKAVLIPDAYQDSRFDPSFDKRSGFVTRSILSVPMIYKGETIGVMNVLNRNDGLPFVEEDKLLLTVFASQAALSIENAWLLQSALENERMEKELKTASEIQRLLLPEQLPAIATLELDARYIPCRQVSGDFYDVFPLDEHRTVLVMADVAGKGVPSAMLVSNLQASLRAFLAFETKLCSIVKRLNETIMHKTTKDRFITFFIALFDDRDNSLQYINAGHNPPLLLNNFGHISELKTGGLFLGYMSTNYELGKTVLNNGELLVMYTDGLVEAMNADQQEFGEKRLVNMIKQTADNSCAAIGDQIIEAVHAHAGQQVFDDDFTLVIVRRKN